MGEDKDMDSFETTYEETDFEVPAVEQAPTGPFATDLEYMQAEVQWVKVRARRIATEHRLAKLEDEPEAPRRRRDYDPASPRALHRLGKKALARELAIRTRLDTRIAAHRASDAPSLAIDQLCERCGLDAFQRMVLILGAAPCFSRGFDALFGQISGEERYEGLTIEGAFAFAELSFADRIERRRDFSRSGALVSQDLIDFALGHRYQSAKDLLGADIDITPRTLNILLGRNDLDEEFLEFSSVELPRADFGQLVLDEDVKQKLLSVVEDHERYLDCRRDWGFDDIIQYGRGSMLLFYGPPGTGKTMTAHAIADKVGKRLLNVDIPTFVENSEADRFLPGLFREARLQNAILFFDECEVLFGSRRNGNALMTLLLTELERFEGIAIFATNLPDALDEAFERRVLLRVPFAEPTADARAAIWRRHIPETAPVSADVDFDALGTRYPLSGGYIKNAVLAAVASVVHSGREVLEITMSDLEMAARDQTGSVDMDGSRRQVPKARLRDVVLPSAQEARIKELLNAVRHRPTLMKSWGIGGTRDECTGLAALFYGPPGTGKTLCAEALAGELSQPLLRARTSTLLSKWVGDSERNLATLFKTAQAENAVLLIDEADSLLGQRSAQDSRHDRSMVNLLLDLIERHPGLVLLATNQETSLDPAVERRLVYRVAFARPAFEARVRLWTTLLPAAEHCEDCVDARALAACAELSGAEIRSVLLRAGSLAIGDKSKLTQTALMAVAAEFVRGRRTDKSIGFDAGDFAA